MFPRTRSSVCGVCLLAFLLAWGCGEDAPAPGSLVWAKRAGGTDYDGGNGVAVLSDGSAFVTGYLRVTATFGPGELGETSLTSAGNYDIFLARYNPDGTLCWAKRAGGTSWEWGNGVAGLSDGSALVAGQFRDTVTFEPGESGETDLASAGTDDIFLARYDSGGALLWAKGAGGPDGDCGYGVAVLSDGSAFVTGWSSATATFGPGESGETSLDSAGGSDIFLARYDSDGTLRWAKRAGGISSDKGTGVAVLSDGSALVSGQFRDTATFGPGEARETSLTTAGLLDIFLARYDPDGTLRWAKRAGGTSDDWGSSVTVLSDGSALVTGTFGGTATFGPGEAGGTSLTSDGGADIFLARYDSEGSLRWAKRAGGAGDERGVSVAVLSDGSAFVTGYFEGAATFGPGEAAETTLTYPGSADMFLARYDSDGSLRWAKRAGGIGNDRGVSVAVLSDGSAFATGHLEGTATFGPGETVLTSAGSQDIFLVRFNP